MNTTTNTAATTTITTMIEDMTIVYNTNRITIATEGALVLTVNGDRTTAELKRTKKESIVKDVTVTEEKIVRTYKRTKKEQGRIDWLTNNKKEIPIVDSKVEEVYSRQHCGFNSVETYITCNCCMNKVGDILPKVATLNAGMGKIVEMFAKVNLVDERGYMLPVYGDNNADAFRTFSQRAYDHVVTTNKGNFIPKPVFTELVKVNRKERMDVAYGLQKDYWTMKGEISDLWANMATAIVGDKVADGHETYNRCPICGSSDIQIMSAGRTWHLGLTKDALKTEDYNYGFKDNMSNGIYMEDKYVVTSERDLDVYKWVEEDMADAAEYKYNCDRDEAEDMFYELAPHMPIEKVCVKLGMKANLIADIIAEYYSTKMSITTTM